jgi:hypothetical protein
MKIALYNGNIFLKLFIYKHIVFIVFTGIPEIVNLIFYTNKSFLFQ